MVFVLLVVGLRGVGAEPVEGPAPGAGADSAAASPSPAAAAADSFWVLGDSVRVPTGLAGKRIREFIEASIDLNARAVLALHAEPAGSRLTPVQVTGRITVCDGLRTAVPPGEWEVFVIAAGYDHIAGAMFSFKLPEDWIIHGFKLNPELGNPLMVGGLRQGDARPRLVAFDCISHPDHTDLLLPQIGYTTQRIVVIGSLDLTATTPGSLELVSHSIPAYGPPELATCFTTSVDLRRTALGRIDVGRGPGVRPCEAGGMLHKGLARGAGRGGDTGDAGGGGDGGRAGDGGDGGDGGD